MATARQNRFGTVPLNFSSRRDVDGDSDAVSDSDDTDDTEGRGKSAWFSALGSVVVRRHRGIGGMPRCVGFVISVH